jgi:hypothetical protein
MQRRHFVAAVAVAMLAGLGRVSAQDTRFGLTAADWQFARRWLETNCLAPSAQPFLAELRSRSAVMQRAFIGALDEGPLPDEIAGVREGARARYRQGRQLLERGELADALPPERLAAVRSVTEDGFIAAEVDSFVNGYRSNAMAGLAVVGDDVAVARLKQMAADRSPALASAARAALAYRQPARQP